MPTVKGNFLGARKLKNEKRTGMITFPEGTDRHALADLEGEIYLTNEKPGETENRELADIYMMLARIEQMLQEKYGPLPEEKTEGEAGEPLFAGQEETQEEPDAR